MPRSLITSYFFHVKLCHKHKIAAQDLFLLFVWYMIVITLEMLFEIIAPLKVRICAAHFGKAVTPVILKDSVGKRSADGESKNLALYHHVSDVKSNPAVH